MSKLLLIAPTDRDDVGEAWVAYQWASRLSDRHEVTLLTYRKRGKPSAADQLPNTRVIEWTEPRLVGRLERLNSMLKPAWIRFYFAARRWVKNAIAQGERFELAHQPVPVAMRYPIPVLGLGIPYVIGPVGGGLDSPPAFTGQDTAPWYVRLRAFDTWRLRHDRYLRRTYQEAACVIGIAPYVEAALRGIPMRRFEVMSETGIAELPPAVDRSGHVHPVRLLFVGRLIRTKGARDAINALSLVPDLPVVLDIIGDGFDRAECERLVDRLGLGDRVTFHGALPRAAVEDFYTAADIFVFPSFREPGGNVVFEAMAGGLPLIVANRGGPGNVVDDSCGIRLDPQTPEQYARDIAAAIRKLVDDTELRRSLGAGARARAARIALWDSKIDAMCDLYEELLIPG